MVILVNKENEMSKYFIRYHDNKYDIAEVHADYTDEAIRLFCESELQSEIRMDWENVRVNVSSSNTFEKFTTYEVNLIPQQFHLKILY